MKFRDIIFLNKENNAKGDLLGRMMGDLFHCLGYNEPKINIQKSGREVDLICHHRVENKVAVAECKAQGEKIGGADINKFIGVLDVEKRKYKKENRKTSVIGYFISTSGFKETAIEQEREAENSRVILLKPEKIVEELINGKIIVSLERAVASITLDDSFVLIPHADLVAHEKGWVWVLYLSNTFGQSTTHFALIHAEGKPLVKDLAEEIIQADSRFNNLFSDITLLKNLKNKETVGDKFAETRTKYFRYLESELGEIQFEGLPTDKEAGAVKVKLEDIFVPLHLVRRESDLNNSNADNSARIGIGEALAQKTRLAILAKPGGGKSTLIKRIAIAYAFPSRRTDIDDNLPDKTWFPIFLRCRELGSNVSLSITEIINKIPLRAEISSHLEYFSALVSDALQNGHGLLLIDGLDEIAEDKSRIGFVNQLRTFIATYPTLNIIVTSREAGFRAVGGSLSTYCDHYTVSPLTASEIENLSKKWHRSIIDESENTLREAQKLNDIIIRDVRIRVLAENPLLLTTLLFVRRWAGYLPTKRSVLYQEMIKLLLVTWNVEGHEQLDIDEAEPQLAFVAYWMMKNGRQTITSEELNSCLIEARKQMPEILGYTKISPAEFIKRVESRSSILIMAGHTKLATGNITPIYEFLHLSFQEYLTAKAIVKGFIARGEADGDIVKILRPHFSNESWKEVIPLVAVLMEREAKTLIEFLISSLLKSGKRRWSYRNNFPVYLLGNCLANEIQISPALLDTAIEAYIKIDRLGPDDPVVPIILKSKFGSTFKNKSRECFFGTYLDENAIALANNLAEIFLIESGDSGRDHFLDFFLGASNWETYQDGCCAILGLMLFSYKNHYEASKINREKADEAVAKVLSFAQNSDPQSILSVAWCVAWVEECRILPEKYKQPLADILIPQWISTPHNNLQNVISWALKAILKPSINCHAVENMALLKQKIAERLTNPSETFDEIVALYLAMLVGEPYNKNAAMATLKDEIQKTDKANINSTPFKFAQAMNLDLKELVTK